MLPDSTASSSGSQTAPDPAARIAELEKENQALRNTEPAASTSQVETPAEPIAPLQALADSVEKAKNNGEDIGFVGHLERLAEDGIKAAVNPRSESDVLGVLAAIVSDIVKVKL